MTLYDYEEARKIVGEGHPFYALIMAALFQADTNNAERIKLAWPELHAEVVKRYHSRGGELEGDRAATTNIVRELTETDRFTITGERP